MTVVAIALVVALAAAVWVFAGLLRSQQRAHARREDLLLNQLLHVAGKPWQPAPADAHAGEPEERREPAPPRFTPSPGAFEHPFGLAALDPLEPAVVPSDWSEA